MIPTALTFLIALTMVLVHFRAARSVPIFTETERLILAALYLGAVVFILATWLIWSLFHG